MTDSSAQAPAAPVGSRISARWRIVGWIMLTTALTLLAVIVTVRSILMASVDRTANEAILQEAGEFTTFVEEAVDPETAEPFENETALLERYLSRQTPATGETFITRDDAGDRQVLDNAGSGVGRDFASRDRVVEQLMDSEERSGILDTEDFGEIRWGRIDTDGGSSLLVLQFLAGPQEEVEQEALTIIGVASGGLLLTAAIAWLISGRILQPVRRIGDVAGSVNDQDLSQRVPVEGRDDISRTAEAVNEMLDRLEESYARQRHFIAQAHQHLAEPLQSGLGAMEGVDTSEASAVRRSLRDMSQTLHDLQLLAEAQTPGYLRRGEIGADRLLMQLHRNARHQHPDREFLIAVPSAAGDITGEDALAQLTGLSAWLDAGAVGAALAQIVRNAAEHTYPGAQIRMSAQRVEAAGEETQDATGLLDVPALRVAVANDGAPINEAEAAAMLEQFRLDPPAEQHAGQTREQPVEQPAGQQSTKDNADVTVSGMGLGMAVARTVADAHGGSLWVTSGPDESTVVGMDLPLGEQPEEQDATDD